MSGALTCRANDIGISFASTYALGQLANRYHGGKRMMSGAVLKQTFDELLAAAKALQALYVPQLQEKVRHLKVADVLAMVKGRMV